jgi:hypothetical protein
LRESVCARLLLDLRVVEVGKFLGSADIGHLFDEALGEDEIDFFEGAFLGLRVLREKLTQNEGGRRRDGLRRSR